MTRHARPRAALVLHLFHEDVALDLIRRVGALETELGIIATGPRPSPRVAAALAGLKRLEWIETPNEGFDVAPFLAVLPLLRKRGYELVCKLHTKKGHSGFGRRWRDALLGALIGSDRIVAGTIEAFATNPDLALAGPADLYLSAAMNMTANGPGVERLAPIVFPALALPADWGFFAGTMFWARVADLRRFAPLADVADLWQGGARRDGGAAHAIERLFGLIPVATDGRVGLRAAGGGPLRIDRPVGAPLEILEALARMGRPSAAPDLDLVETGFVRRHNPLLHYLATRGAIADPHPLFASEWYAKRNAVPRDTNPLEHFLRLGAMAPDPSPLFQAAAYVGRRPWLKRRDENPLVHHLRELDGDGRSAEVDREVRSTRPHTPPVDPFARMARRAQLRRFLGAGALQSLAVKIGASRQSRSEWGDVHFAEGFVRAVAGTGIEARVDYREDWHRHHDVPDIAIALRGPVRYAPRPDSFNILWIISHPDQVSLDEMEEFDLVYVASESFAALLRHWIDVPVLSLLQATDERRFVPPARHVNSGTLFFAGNTRGQDRKLVRWAVELGLPLEVHGFGWEAMVPAKALKGERIANTELPARYADAAAVLGDHWPAMADFGFVSNRIFDVLAAGGIPVTDSFPAIARTVGNAAITIGARDEVPSAIAAAAERPVAIRRARSGWVREEHGFGTRAQTILRDVAAFAGGRFQRAAPRRGPRVHVVHDPHDPRAAWSLARRLLGPLTTDDAALRSLTFGSPGERLPAADVILAVPGAAKAGAWEPLIHGIGSRRLVVDAGALGSAGRPVPAALRPLWAAATEHWWPEARRRPRRSPESRVVPDSVDPRLWRDYHAGSRWDFVAMPLRCVLVAPHGLDAVTAARLGRAFADVPAELTIVGPAPTASGPWTNVPLPKGKSAYASFARWLRAQPFHVGLCLPLSAGGRDADLAFLDFSACGMLSLAPADLMTDAEIASSALAIPIAADLSDLSEVLSRVAAAPGRHAGIAAAAAAHVWSTRSAAATGAIIAGLLGRSRKSRAVS